MKRVYERPVFLIEEFAPNRVIAATCTNTNINVDSTKCFIGSTVKTENIIAELVEGSSCGTNVLYAEGATTAYHPNGTAGTSGAQVTSNPYKPAGDPLGLLLWCAKTTDGTTTYSYEAWSWSEGDTQANHKAITDYTDSLHIAKTKDGKTSLDGKGLHCHVLPVYVEISVS